MRFPRSVRLFPLLLAALGLLLAAPGGALAAKPTFHDRETFTVPDNEICGVAGSSVVTLSQIGTGTGAGFVVTGQVTEVFTAADGRTATIHVAGPSRASVVDNGDGTVTVTNTWAGLPEQIRGGGGGVETFDAGLLTLVQTVDVAGPEPVLLSSAVVAEHGPHPEADADFAIFCDAFLAALG